MTSDHRSDDRPDENGPLASGLSDLRRRLDRARRGGPPDGDVLVADLETAYEELRTADDELRAQLEQINEITLDAEVLRHQQERLLSVLPVPSLSTDEHGVILAANAASAALAGTRADRLVGKPVLTLFALEDRQALRTRISHQGREGGVFRQRATVVDRRGATYAVDLTAAVVTGGAPQVTWVLLPDVELPGTAGATRHLLPEVLVRLAALPTTTRSTPELLDRAAALCRAALGHDVELSVAIGPAARPEVVATTDPVAQHLDDLQALEGQGPSREARHLVATVTAEDLRTDARWPALTADVPGTIGAVVSSAIVADGVVLGVLSVYRNRVGTDPVLVETVELLASTLAALLLELDLAAELRATASEMERALSSRTTVDQARGMVMAQQRCTAAEAFAWLAGLAADRGLGVAELARQLVDGNDGFLDDRS